ncbi:MAG TPA: FAD-dependent oxidoreductase [Steroidobacteraceae bacterium]|nr:FAD-dependent oxidoreductase [Steroidobacteraceae bacterium]
MSRARRGARAARKRSTPGARPSARARGAATYDLAIVGAGPAGLAAAERAAAIGARVALIERAKLGGVSLNNGSIPSKALIRSATLFAALREVWGYLDVGLEPPKANLARVVQRLRQIEGRIGGYHSLERLRRIGVDVHFGAALFTGERSLKAGDSRIAFRHALIATGACTLPPNIPGLKRGSYLTSESIFDLRELPQRLAVVGGGPLGCELAQAFCRLGSEVTIIQDDAKFLPREERDAAQILAQSMARDGVDIRLNTRVVGARVEAGTVTLETENYQTRREISADRVLVSVGRGAYTDGLGLDAAGVRFDQARGVLVDDFMRTSNPAIYAAGDVCMEDKYTHVAQSTAEIAVHNALRGTHERHSRLTIPWCTFCVPEVAHVGLQVWQARERSLPVKTYTVMMQDIDRAITDRQDLGFVKLHVAEGSDRVLGATIVASRASEMINEVCVAMNTGIGLRALAKVIHTYPSQSAAIRYAAMTFDGPAFPGEIPLTTRLAPR